jgi:AraC family transcriptional regulator, activator of mtrCDE
MQKQSIIGDYDPVVLADEFPISIPSTVMNRATSLSAPNRNINLSPHIHDCFELGFCVSGDGTFLVEDKILDYSGGDAIIINNREFHLLEPESRNRSVWWFSNLDPAKLLAGIVPPAENCFDTSMLCGSNFNNVISSKKYFNITNLIKNIFDELLNGKTGYQSAVRGLVWSLMVKLQRLKMDTGELPAQRVKDIKFLLPALEFISHNFSAPVEIPDLAQRCNCSPSTFRRIFNKNFKCSPLQYINLLRLRVAGSLLKNTRLPVLEIALRCGFPTLSNFNRQFKKFYAMSPRQWRNRKDSTILSE